MTNVVQPAPPPSPLQEPAPAETTHLQRVSRHGFIYGIGFLISRAVGFVMLPVYTRFLTPADYGILQLIELTFEIVIIVAGARLASGIFHFFHKARDDRERSAVLTTTLALMFASYVVVTSLVFVAAPAISGLVFRSRDHADLIRIAAVGLAFQSLLLVPMAYFQVRERSHHYVLANTVKMVIQLSLNIVTVVGLHMGARGVLIATLVGNAVVGTWLAGWMLKELGFVLSGAVARSVFVFSLPLVAMQFATFVSTYGDRFFLQRAFPSAADGDAAVGIYGLAYQFGFLLNSVGFYPFYNIWEPMRFEIAKHADRDRLYSRGFLYFNLVYLTIGLVIGLMVFDLLRIVAAPAFVAAATMAPVVMLAYVLQGWTDIQNIGLLITERTSLLSLANWVAAGVALLGYLLLIPRFHGMGAAVATVLSFAVRHALVLSLSQRYWPVRYDWTPVLKVLLAAISFVAVGMALPPVAIPLSILIRLGMIGLYALVIWNLGVLNDTDRAFLLRFVRSPRGAIAGLRQAFAAR